MSTKRILAAVLGILMLAVLAVPALAYTTPYVSYQQLTEAAESKFYISGSQAAFDLFGGTGRNPSTKTATISLTDEVGAWHLTGTGAYATGAVGKANTSNEYSQFVDNTKGMTFDLYAKFDELPTLETNVDMLDTGAPAGNPNNLYFAGLVFNLCSAEYYMADTSKSNNELQAIFATYYNDELGTDTVVFLPYGNRNAWASNSSCVTYFFDNPGEYARYTFTFDAVNGTTQFFINGEAQVAAGDETAVHDAVALSYRATATTNFLNINLNSTQAPIANSETGHDFYIDQLDVYPDALIPSADDFLFGDEVYVEPTVPTNADFTNAYGYYRDFEAMADEYFNPTFWNAFEGFINYGLDIIENGTQEELDAIASSGVGANWFINRLVFKSTAGVNTTTGGSDATVNGTGTVIPAATPILIGYDKLWISHIDTDGLDLPWSYSSTIVTKAGLNVGTDLTSFGGDLFTAVWRVYICEPTNVDGYYTVVSLGGNTSTTRPVIPEGGFAIIMHTNSKNMSTLSTSAVEFNKYNSGLFFARNVHAVYSAGIANGGYVKLTGVDLEAGTMTQEGTWLTYKDPAMTDAIGDHVYRTGYLELAAADAEGRTTATRDQFAGFKSGAYIEAVAELPVVGEQINVTVKGEGTVTAAVNGTETALDNIFAETGDTVTLTANGEGFKYWIGGNDAVVSTAASLAIPGGKALNFTAVFEDNAEAETVNVYFKDSKTGKVWATKEVAVGSALVTSDVTAALKGYTFAGWSVAEGTVINATTEVYTKYAKDTNTVAITIEDGNSVVTDRAYGSVLAVSAKGDNFSYWTLNDVIVSTDADYRFNTPSAAATLKAVYGATDAPAAVAATVDLSKDGQTFYYLMSRAVKEGTITETGVLMTRKATEADLTVDTTVNTVTKGISTASADYDVVGFVKDATGKTGTWLVKGYVTYEIEGVATTVYTDVASIVIE